MRVGRVLGRIGASAIALAITLPIVACQDATGPVSGSVLAARGGNGGGNGGGGNGGGASGSKAEPSVNAVFPDSAVQDTTIDVEVSGSDFDAGSQVSFERGGVTDPELQVNGTQFINRKKLVANVTVTAAAETGLYDVAVTSSKGRKGVGIELFRVDERVEATFADAASDGMVSDGGGAYATSAIDIFLTVDARAGTTPRTLCFNFHGQLAPGEVGFSDQAGPVLCDDGYLTTGLDNFLADNATPGVALADMPIGGVQRSRLGGFYVREGFNWSFSYGRDCDSNDIPDERATVTRISSTEWSVEASTMNLCRTRTKGPPKNDGVVATGLNMPVTLAVEIVYGP